MPRAMTRVYLPDGRYKTIVVESDQTVRDLIPIVTEKFQATSTENFSNYVLFESLDNEKVINELSLTSRPYDITIQWKPESNNRLIFKRTNQSVLVHDTGFVPPPSTTVLPDAPKNNPPRYGSIPPPYTPYASDVPPPYSAAPQGQPPLPARKLPTGAQPLFTPGASGNSNTMRKRAPSDATPPQGPTQSYQPVNAPSGNTAELQERLNKMRAAEQEKKTQDIVQKQSIAVWCNYHLKSTGAEISDIVSDFSNGENFALLIQALTQKPIKINQNPRTYQEKMENLRGSFAVLESIGAKPRGCGPEDFLNGNEKAIMGLLLLLVGKFKDVSKRASSRFSTILTSQGAAVSSAPSRPPPQRPPRPPGQGTMSRPTPGASNAIPTPQPSLSTSPPSRPQPGGLATSPPARPQPSQPPARPVPAPKTTAAPPPSSAPPQQPPPAQPSRPVRPAVPPRSSLDPEATSTPKQSTSVPPKPSTMRDRPSSAVDSAPAPAPKTTTAPPAFQPPPPKTPTKQSSAPPATTAPPAESTGKSPFSQPARTNPAPAPAPAPVKRPAPPPVKAKAAEPPPPQPAPSLPPPVQQKPEEDEFALDELDQMMDTIQSTSSFIAPPPSKEPESSKSSSTPAPTSFAKFPTLDDEDDLGEITLLAESLSEITTAAPSGNLPIRKLSNAVLPTVQPTPTPTTTAKAPSPAPAEEEPHFEDFDELEDFLADLANELGVQLGEMDSSKPKDNNDLNSLDLNFDI